MLDATARQPLRDAADGDPYVLRLRELRSARPWLERLQIGQRLVVEMEEWVNKSCGRGTIALAVDHEDGSKPEEIAAWSASSSLQMRSRTARLAAATQSGVRSALFTGQPPECTLLRLFVVPPAGPVPHAHQTTTAATRS